MIFFVPFYEYFNFVWDNFKEKVHLEATVTEYIILTVFRTRNLKNDL